MTPEADAILKEFLASVPAHARGGVMTDLDGTAVHEFDDCIVIPHRVADALKTLNERGRPVIINSLRFPLNVIRTFGREWYAITNAPLPMVSLNGSQIGYLDETKDGAIGFREIDAFPLTSAEIGTAVGAVEDLAGQGHDGLALFIYPRDWTRGELIWTPAQARVDMLTSKYPSASRVFSTSVAELEDALLAEAHCMLFLLVETVGDRLMAYQHVSHSRFITRAGVDKRHGAHALCEALKLDITASIGAGDTIMDTFLDGIGLAVTVGAGELAFKGKLGNLRVRNSLELGDLLFRLAEIDSDQRAA